jgi:hypothetical protein
LTQCIHGKSVVRPKYIKLIALHRPETYFGTEEVVVDLPASFGFVQHWSSRPMEGLPRVDRNISLTDCATLKRPNETFINPVEFV